MSSASVTVWHHRASPAHLGVDRRTRVAARLSRQIDRDRQTRSVAVTLPKLSLADDDVSDSERRVSK
jgi:hypothetical protein